MNKRSTTIIGVDPGTRITGYGIIVIEGNRQRTLDYGCIKTSSKHKLTERYRIIYDSLNELLERYEPDYLSVETQYIKHNPQSAIKLGMARGIILLAATKRNIPSFEYAPSRAKSAVVGTGRASKEQVVSMIQKLLNLSSSKIPEDAADALALAICHAQALNFKERLAHPL